MKPWPPMLRLILPLGILVCAVLLGSCARPAGEPHDDGMVRVAGPWQFRWGDSPRDAQGALFWLREDATTADGSGWQLSDRGTRPSGHGNNQFLWLRTRLSGPRFENPILYILVVEQLFEAYLDGKLIYRFGDLDDVAQRRFRGNRTHSIALPADYSGQMLALRIFSNYTDIGVGGEVRIGNVFSVISTMLREDAADAAIGSILCALGLFAIGLFLLQRSEVGHLYYGCFALAMGVWLLCQMQSRTFLINAPMRLFTVEVFALYFAVAFLLRFVLALFGRGPFGFTRILCYVIFGYVISVAVLVAFGRVALLSTLVPFHLILVCGILYTLILMGVLSVRGNVEARLFALGFVGAALFGIYDTLAVHGLIPRSRLSFSQFGQAAFVLSLGLILARRFRNMHRSLADAEKRLSEKVATLEERNREVQQLNDDLHRQIEARSKDLAASILEASNSFSELEVQILGPGFVIADRYRVIRLIGQGGMGAVYEVERITDGRHLAAKVLSVQAGKRGLARFAREAQLLARLKHPNLVNIQDIDMTQSHMAYIVMELVIGNNLGALATKFGDVKFAKKVLGQVADALATVHGQGIVHRDLKPENVLIQHPDDFQRMTAKLVDFGVSMLLDETVVPGAALGEGLSSTGRDVSIPDTAFGITISDDEHPPSPEAPRPVTGGDRKSAQGSQAGRDRISGRPLDLTQTGVIMGTPLYMAPELRQGAKYARPSSDMFSFGVMAYELLAGQLPSETPALFHTFKPGVRWFPALLTRCPELPGPLAEIVERCLDPHPEQRPTAAEVKAAFA